MSLHIKKKDLWREVKNLVKILVKSVNTYTIYVHCLKISNLFVRALETGNASRFRRAFFTLFAARTNEFDISGYVRILFFILQFLKSAKMDDFNFKTIEIVPTILHSNESGLSTGYLSVRS